MFNSAVINIRCVSLPPCQLPKVDLSSAGFNPTQQGFGTQPSYEAPGNLLVEQVVVL